MSEIHNFVNSLKYHKFSDIGISFLRDKIAQVTDLRNRNLNVERLLILSNIPPMTTLEF